MKRRRWRPEQKALIVLEGVKGRPVGALGAEHQISQAQDEQGRNPFLANAAQACAPAGAPPARAGANAQMRASRA